MKQGKRIGIVVLFWLMVVAVAVGCGKDTDSWKTTEHTIRKELTYETSMKLDYATEFAVDYYDNGFTLISIADGSRFLLNTEDRSKRC